MNRRFPLAAVLRVRRLQQDVARADLLRARAAEQAAAAVATAIGKRLDAARPPRSAPADVFLSAAGFHLALADDLTIARRRRAAAAEDTGLAHADWSATARRVKGLDVLADRHVAALRADEERNAQREIDDRASYAVASRASYAVESGASYAVESGASYAVESGASYAVESRAYDVTGQGGVR